MSLTENKRATLIMKSKLCLLLVIAIGSNCNLLSAANSSLSELAHANNTFAFKLLKQLSVEQPQASILVSPYSAATALQLVARGAAGRTLREMQQALEISDLSTDALNAATKAATEGLNPKDTNVILTTANALWYRQGVTMKPAFLEASRQFSDVAIRPLDFNNASAAEATINQWASDQTHGRITAIADGLIDPIYTDLVLANAIYFKGRWHAPFDAKLTKERPFHPMVGPAKNRPMMEKHSRFTYRQGSGYQAVRLPYVGWRLGMYVFLPDPGSNPTKLLRIMNGDNWRRVTIPGFSKRDGWLVLPKFKLENTLDLKPAVQALGIKTAFNAQKKQPDADFSGMFDEPHHLSAVRQKAFVEVNEQGTEAAAVTGLTAKSAGPQSDPPKPFQMIVDRPFLFAIVDAQTEMILFMGLINEL